MVKTFQGSGRWNHEEGVKTPPASLDQSSGGACAVRHRGHHAWASITGGGSEQGKMSGRRSERISALARARVAFQVAEQ